MGSAEFRNSADYLFDSEMGREALAIATAALDEDPDMPLDQVYLRVFYGLVYHEDTDTYVERKYSVETAVLAVDFARVQQYEMDFVALEQGEV